MIKLLPALDAFESALNALGASDDKTNEGFRLIYNNILEVLRAEGLEGISAMGERFDPFRHEAVIEVSNPGGEDGTIVEVVQKGYSFRSKVIRISFMDVIMRGSSR
jgi:molecular chaperone GrpE